MKMVNDITWFQKEAGEVVKGGAGEVTMVGSVLLTSIIIMQKSKEKLGPKSSLKLHPVLPMLRTRLV